MDFGGVTYSPKHDLVRLESQLERVKELMSDGQWRTLPQIREAVGGSEAGISARLRDLRKEKFGAYAVNRRRRGVSEYGIWQYQLSIPVKAFEAITEANGQRAFL